MTVYKRRISKCASARQRLAEANVGSSIGYCPQCCELFGSNAAFDRHQRMDVEEETGRAVVVCLPRSRFSELMGKKTKRPRLVWHPTRHLWVTALDDPSRHRKVQDPSEEDLQ